MFLIILFFFRKRTPSSSSSSSASTDNSSIKVTAKYAKITKKDFSDAQESAYSKKKKTSSSSSSSSTSDEKQVVKPINLKKTLPISKLGITNSKTNDPIQKTVAPKTNNRLEKVTKKITSFSSSDSSSSSSSSDDSVEEVATVKKNPVSLTIKNPKPSNNTYMVKTKTGTNKPTESVPNGLSASSTSNCSKTGVDFQISSLNRNSMSTPNSMPEVKKISKTNSSLTKESPVKKKVDFAKVMAAKDKYENTSEVFVSGGSPKINFSDLSKNSINTETSDLSKSSEKIKSKVNLVSCKNLSSKSEVPLKSTEEMLSAKTLRNRRRRQRRAQRSKNDRKDENFDNEDVSFLFLKSVVIIFSNHKNL